MAPIPLGSLLEPWCYMQSVAYQGTIIWWLIYFQFLCSKKLESSQWSLKYIFTPSVPASQYPFLSIYYMLSFSHNDLFGSPQTHWMSSASLRCSSRYPLELLSLPQDLCSDTIMPRGISLEHLKTYCLFHLFVLFFPVLTNTLKCIYCSSFFSLPSP